MMTPDRPNPDRNYNFRQDLVPQQDLNIQNSDLSTNYWMKALSATKLFLAFAFTESFKIKISFIPKVGGEWDRNVAAFSLMHSPSTEILMGFDYDEEVDPAPEEYRGLIDLRQSMGLPFWSVEKNSPYFIGSATNIDRNNLELATVSKIPELKGQPQWKLAGLDNESILKWY